MARRRLWWAVPHPKLLLVISGDFLNCLYKCLFNLFSINCIVKIKSKNLLFYNFILNNNLPDNKFNGG
jgi:hypothetical protein